MQRLVIAENPSVAQSIAAVIGAKQKRDGYLTIVLLQAAGGGAA